MLKEEDKKRLQERFQEEASDVYQPFSKELFKQYSVKRGLRNDDGTGVMAGLTSVGAVLGYYIDDGEKIPMEGFGRFFKTYRKSSCIAGRLCGRYDFESS